MGLGLSVLFLTSAFAAVSQIAGLLSLLIMAAVPAGLFISLRSTYVKQQGMSTFSALWMQGIMVMGCGTLIASAVAVVYLKWIDPGWLMRQVEAMIATYSAIEGGEWVVNALNEMVEYHLLPTVGQMVAQMLWLMLFTGSILSLILTAIVRMRKINQNPK